MYKDVNFAPDNKLEPYEIQILVVLYLAMRNLDGKFIMTREVAEIICMSRL